MDKQQYLSNSLADWLRQSGLQVSLAPEPIGSLRPDMVAHHGADVILVEAKVAHAYRSKVFPALVGDAILRVKHADSAAGLLVAFLVTKLNCNAIGDLERYARDYFPDLNWFLLDEQGAGVACLHGQRSELSFFPYQQESGSHGCVSPFRGGLFSPSACRLLKVLLLAGIDARYWGGPQHRPKGIVELARASGVSQPAVSSLVKRFEETGYVRRQEGAPMVVVRHQELLDDWFHSRKHRDRGQVPVRSMYGDSVAAVVEKIRAQYGSQNKPRAIIGYHLACHLHGIGRSNVNSAMVYISEAKSKVMDELDLVTDDSSSPSLWLVSGDFASVCQGAVLAHGVPVCDILQCYLDVRGSRARGQEQAEYIMDNILMPHFRSCS